MNYTHSFLLLLVLVAQFSSTCRANVPFISQDVNLQNYLSIDYYQARCPQLEQIIQKHVFAWIKKDPTIAPALIRLHFHDCAVRGCDGSILLNHANSERASPVSKSLRGFELIDEIKSEVEKRWPRTVSCADILTAAARDATLKVGGPFWEVSFGRKDGRISYAKEAETLPSSHDSVTGMMEFFQSIGLNLLDLVVLSGAHTIGRATCGSVQNRLFNYNGTGKPDPSMDKGYLMFLRIKCRWQSEYVNLDAISPAKFDETYYKNLQRKMGLLSTDQLLYSDSRTQPLVQALATQGSLFSQQFAVSMIKLGNTKVLTGKYEGEIRRNCNYINK